MFSGMKIAVPLAMVGAIVAEFIAAQRGLGNLILTTSQSLNMALNFAALIAITIWSSLLFQAVVVAERLVLRRMHTSPAA
jgi:NitT/TauT family transport system permease protein